MIGDQQALSKNLQLDLKWVATATPYLVSHLAYDPTLSKQSSYHRLHMI